MYFRKTPALRPSFQTETNAMQTHSATPSESKRSTTFVTDCEIDAFLSAAVCEAEHAAEDCRGLSRRAPAPFDSLEEWYAFDAALERRLAAGGERRAQNAA